jgi:hypothetical protein
LNRTIATLSRKFDQAYVMGEMSWTGEVHCVCDNIQQVGTARGEWFRFDGHFNSKVVLFSSEIQTQQVFSSCAQMALKFFYRDSQKKMTLHLNS